MSKSVAAVYETNLKSLPLVQKGKVRDIYAVGEDHFLIVTTDRLSAFDVVLPDPVPRKGAILTEISNFWFERTSGIIRNHLTDMTLESVVPNAAELGKKILNESGLTIQAADDLDDAAQKIVAAVG